MRISDWSSDVCSSDLRNCHGGCPNNHYTAANDTAVYCPPRSSAVGGFNRSRQPGDGLRRGGERQDDGHALLGRRAAKGGAPPIMAGGASRHFESRSEEHTSELQSLMRISYAVFCLKKNNN